MSASNSLRMKTYRLRMKARDFVANHGFDNDHLDVLMRLPKLGTWGRERVPTGAPQFERRFELYDHLQREVLGDEPMDYLEFGVYKGESMGYWSDIHAHPESRFYGFDSFEGLPESWTYFGGTLDSATFDAGGEVPQIDDDRVHFVKGLFQDSVPGFLEEFEPRSRLVVNCDADLYSSTLYTLTQCDPILVPGSVVLFDEFASVMDEFSALRDYCAAYRREYDVLATTRQFAQVAIVMR